MQSSAQRACIPLAIPFSFFVNAIVIHDMFVYFKAWHVEALA